jgi:hypothetical protein
MDRKQEMRKLKQKNEALQEVLKEERMDREQEVRELKQESEALQEELKEENTDREQEVSKLIQEIAALRKRLEEEKKRTEAALEAHSEQMARNGKIVDIWAEGIEKDLIKRLEIVTHERDELRKKLEQLSDNQSTAMAQCAQDVMRPSADTRRIFESHQQPQQRYNGLRRHIYSLRRQALGHRGQQVTLLQNNRVLEHRYHQHRKYSAPLQARYRVLQQLYWAKTVIAQRNSERATHLKRHLDKAETKARASKRQNSLLKSKIRCLKSLLRTTSGNQDEERHNEQVLTDLGYPLLNSLHSISPQMLPRVTILIYIFIHRSNADAQEEPPHSMPALLPAPAVDVEVQSIVMGASSSVNDNYPPLPPATSLSTLLRRSDWTPRRDKQVKRQKMEMVRKRGRYA